MTSTAAPSDAQTSPPERRPAWLTRLGLLGLLAVSLGGFLGAWYWGLDLLSHARLQYLLMALPALVVAAVLRDRVAVTLAVLVIGINGLQVAPLYVASSSPPDETADSLRVLTFNVFDGNRNHADIIEVIESSAADVVFVHELGGRLRMSLEEGLNGYVWAMEDGWGFASGSGALVREGIEVTPTTLRVGPSSRFPTVSLMYEGTSLDIVGVHPLSPVSPGRSRARDRTLEDVAEWVRSRDGEIVIAGDFNASPFSAAYRSFESLSGLTSTLNGAGWQPTWPDAWSLLQIPIDHAFISDGLAVVDRRTGPHAGSDHASLVVDIAPAR